MKAIATTGLFSKDLELRKELDVSRLEEKAGFVGRLKARYETRKVAGEALKNIENEKVQAEARIAYTAIKISEATICSTLVGNAMPKIGALTTRLNAATTAVNQALTNGFAAEVYTHLVNRRENINLLDELYRSGKISEEEREILIGFAKGCAEDDILRSHKYMIDAKNAVESLHNFALNGIDEAKYVISKKS